MRFTIVCNTRSGSWVEIANGFPSYGGEGTLILSVPSWGGSQRVPISFLLEGSSIKAAFGDAEGTYECYFSYPCVE